MTQQWKPIASAPKDGTPVLLFARLDSAEASTRVVGAYHDSLGWFAQSYSHQKIAQVVPSHWMELPPFPGTPPASAQPERDWELTCDHCNGDGFVYVERQVAERKSDVQEFKEDCECCGGRGFTIAFEDIPGIEAYVKSRRPASASAKDDAKDEKFIQAAVDHATEPLRRLGEYLSRVLDEDQWAIAESMILGACNNAPTNERSMYEAWERTRAGYPFARQFANLMWEAWQARASVAAPSAGDARALLDHPLLRDVLGYIEDAGPADVWGAAQSWMALRDAASQQQEG